MKRIGFYLFNRNISKVDFRHPLDGNPGVGGSEFLTILTAWQLTIRENKLDVTLYVDKEGIFPYGLKTKVVSGIDEALVKAKEDFIDIFIVDLKRLNWRINPFKSISNIDIICWCHNFATTYMSKIMANSLCVKRVVTVGREQMDLYRDGYLFLKSDYIYNAVPLNEKHIMEAVKTSYCERPHNVAYLGSLVEDKCFHVLASIWHRILERVPDAELFVIGSGKVYSQNAKLVKYGIADIEYEKKFMRFLTDKDGNILPSVHFLGSMGEEKYKVLKNIRVGCPNPTGDSETFCLSAVEMQMMGCTVTAMQAPGYYDTFFNGKISKNIDELVENIVYLLTNETPKSYNETIQYIQKHFSVDVVMNDWEKLLLHFDGNYLHPILPLNNPSFRCKSIKEKYRIIRKYLPFLYKLPDIERIISFLKIY